MHRPLWSDELCSQKMAIEQSSWSQILIGQIHELNNPPLYYVLQKAITSMVSLTFPDDFIKDSQLSVEKRKYFLYVYPKGQILLRLLPDIFMTTAIVLLVRFFWIRDGLVPGLMALLSALSVGMVWRYWVEARPYSLWFLLTLLQSLILIEILSQGLRSSVRVKNYLTLCHCFLAVTVTLGLFQIIIAQIILFLFGQRRLGYHLRAGVLPICIALFYFGMRSLTKLSSSKIFDIATDPVDIISSNFSVEQLSILFFYFLAFFSRRIWNSKNDDQNAWKGLAHLWNLTICFFLSIIFLVYVHWRWAGVHKGTPIYDRHFLFLAALGVVLIPAMFSDLWSRSKGSFFWRGVYLVFFIVILFSQFIKGFADAWFQGYYF